MEGIPCVMCTTDKNLGWSMTQVSMNRFGKALCIKHQIEEIKRTYPPKMAEMTLKTNKYYREYLGLGQAA